MTKVIHVHLIFEKKDYYFGSISAIYTVLNDAQIGKFTHICPLPSTLK
ncbi:hypothetical protein PQG94_00660 [Bacteroides stercoris]|jgi:hypothetical protein|nr:hypothetical protein [Bacteroides stercoris]MDC7160323.1 hypothetical protein [Bacteroides stercoris]MDC7169667.1 hypothetical protein [Bacteroides stercoris]